MPVEQRVVSSTRIGARSSGSIGARIKPTEPAEPAEPPKRSRKKLLVVVAVVVLVGGAAAYLLLGRSGSAPDVAAVPPAPQPGAVVTVDPVSVNLADGHYLRLGIALQMTTDVGKDSPDPAKALDLAIAEFSGRSVAEVSDAATREQLKAELLGRLTEAYEGKVMDVYLTNFVTQ